MTTFKLTPETDTSTGNDKFTGGDANDVFKGYGGGTDSLKGMGGNDKFYFQYGQKGLVDGGEGTDSIYMTGHNNHTLDAHLKIVSVENIYLSESNFYASAAQISEFSTINPLYKSGDFYVNIEGRGGKVDLTNSYKAAPTLNINAYDATTSADMTGSKKGDYLDGSAFNDKLNGGLGNDFLTGEDGKDTFIFSTKLGASNVDHITDFFGPADTIQLENSIFKGLDAGKLSASAFKDVGVAGAKVDADDHILYNSKTGVLSYDADGNGASAAVKFAVIDGHPPLTFGDFLVV